MKLNVNQLKIKDETSKNLIALCPFHDDKNNANLHITKTGRWKGYFKCFACGVKGKISPEEVDKMSKLKTISRKPVLTDWDKLNRDYQIQSLIKGTYNELRQQWKVNTLLKYGIGWCGDAHTWPMRNEDGKITGILRRFSDGKKLCVNGSQLGLFLPNMQITRVVIVEGVSDAAIATECGYWGLGLPSASFGHSLAKKFLDNQNYSGKVLIIADADEVGDKSAEKMRKVLTNKFECGIIQMEKYKDLRKFYLNEGKDKTIKLLGG